MEATKAQPLDAAWAICRSVPGLILTAHLLLLVVLSHTSESAAQAFGSLCLAWPILFPVALYFGVAALRYLLRIPGGQPMRGRCLAISVISLLGTLLCGTWFVIVVAHLPNLGN